MKTVTQKKSKGLWFYLLLVLVIFSLLRIFFFETYRISQSSMNNTLFDGDKVLVSKRSKVETNKVYVFQTEAGTYIKRCAGMPGDTVTIKRGIVFINNKRITFPETIIPPVISEMNVFDVQVTNFYNKNWTKDDFGPLVIPNDNYFFLGDNRPASADSRIFGVISKDKIIGKACLILYSTSHWKRSLQQIH